MSTPAVSLDCLGLACPRPIIEVAKRLGAIASGETLEVLADDPAAGPDLAAWCRMRGHELILADPPRFQIRRAG